MLKPTIYCYCDFSVSNDAIANQVTDLLQEISKDFGFITSFIRHSSTDDKGWVGNILNAMESLSDDDYFFIWFDDLLVNHQELSKAISLGLRNVGDYSYIRVTGRPAPIGENVDENHKFIAERECYQCSLVGSLWSIGYFKVLVDVRDTPWEVEGKKHKSKAIGATSRLLIRNTKIKGKDNIFHHPKPSFSIKNISASIPWGLKRFLREMLCKFPRAYHWLYSK